LTVTANYKLTFAVIAGVAIGIAGATVIHAQQGKVAPACLIGEIEITDRVSEIRVGCRGNSRAFQRAISRCGGNRTVALEGDPPKRIVVIKFDNMKKARA
jgi:hypothetical protein